MAEAFADFLVGYVGLCLRETFDGEFSDDDDVSSTMHERKALIYENLNLITLTSLRFIFGLFQGLR
jgi:hypothetical protein